MFRRRRHANDFAEEIQAHLELDADELKDEGLNEEEAHRRAKIAFGNVGAAREQFRLKHRVLWLDHLIRDFRFAIRQMARNPGFAATADLVLGLGMGVSAAIFAFVVSGTDQGILTVRAKSPVLAFCRQRCFLLVATCFVGTYVLVFLGFASSGAGLRRPDRHWSRRRRTARHCHSPAKECSVA